MDFGDSTFGFAGSGGRNTGKSSHAIHTTNAGLNLTNSSSLTFLDPDELIDNPTQQLSADSQAEDFRFQFTLPSQEVHKRKGIDDHLASNMLDLDIIGESQNERSQTDDSSLHRDVPRPKGTESIGGLQQPRLVF